MDATAPVLIVGAGPVGLMAGILLAHQGIACRVVERRDGPQPAPAAHAVNARTFEICRAAGVDMDAIAAAAKPPADAGQVLWVTTLVGEELGRLPYERQGDAELDVTPTPLRNLSQHRFEPILLDTFRRLGGGVAWGHVWESATQDASGVTSRIRDGERTYDVRSRWLLAADGAGSRVRKSVGIEPIGPARMQSFVMIHFEANLRLLVGHRPAVLYWTTDPEAIGTFVAHDIDSTWVYMHSWDPDQESVDDYTEAACAAIVRRALGTDTVPFTIRTISPWTMTAQVAERYRAGRIFLLGDSAHRFPPTGGMGLNTGVQDAHNLAWKLAAVERGGGSDALLDTYETERRPVALENADVSVRNAMRLMEIYATLGTFGDRETARRAFEETLADPAGRERVREAIANQAEHFDMPGLQLGFAYDAGAIVPDPNPRPVPDDPVRQFRPMTRAGCRIPHAWVMRGETRVSTLDLFPLDRFTLITHGDNTLWTTAVAGIDDVPLQCLALDRDVTDPSGAWTALLDLAPGAAVLVRPDQHVAWRASPGDAAALRRTLDTILGTTSEREPT